MTAALATALVAVAIAWLLLWRGVLRPPFDFGPVDEILGALYGVLLAILVLFAAEHYTDARSHAEQEAAGLSDIFRVAATYPPAERDKIRHDAICYAREAILFDWKPNVGLTGSLTLNTRSSQLHQDVEDIAAKHPNSYLLTSLFDGSVKQTEGHQLRLSDRSGRIPPVVWVVIYSGIGIILLFLALRYLPHPRNAVLALGSVAVVMTLMVGMIYMLDHPYGTLIHLKPRALRSLLRVAPLTAGQIPTSVLAPCVALKPTAQSVALSRLDTTRPELPARLRGR